MPSRNSKQLFSALLAGVACQFLWGEPVADSEPEEGPPFLFAQEIVDASLLRSERHQVRPVVEVENFSYVFRIESEYGNFEVVGLESVRACVREIKAIEHLNELTQTQAFTKTVSDRIKDPVLVTVGIARRPVSTVVGLPVGIGRYLQGKLYQFTKRSEKAWATVNEFVDDDDRPSAEAAAADEAATPEADGAKSVKVKIVDSTGKLGRRYLGYDSSKRSWAKRLGVDPYSDNEALQSALGRISWSSSLGAFAADFATPSGDVFSYAGKAQELAWDRPPHQIEQSNQKTLRRLGIGKELLRAFMATRAYSLTEKAAIVLSLAEMEDAAGLDLALELALQAATQDEAKGFVEMFRILENYDRDVSPIVNLELREGLITADTFGGYLMVPLAVDYLHWTSLISRPLLSGELAAEQREVWVSGRVSLIAAGRLRANRWHVFERCLDPERRPASASRSLAPSP